ncbi:MAG: DUF3784 domain-containing protein [Lachnospiraceae bacterium]|nr:DUF3784 domain-containing protein [Lachnospiraceae bacterium]
MTSTEWIAAAVVFIIAVTFAVISFRSFRNRGFLFNNAYIYASKEEREAMDKKPLYRQSAIVFLLLSLLFLIIGSSIIFFDTRIDLLEIPLILAVVIYAVVSTIKIGR